MELYFCPECKQFVEFVNIGQKDDHCPYCGKPVIVIDAVDALNAIAKSLKE